MLDNFINAELDKLRSKLQLNNIPEDIIEEKVDSVIDDIIKKLSKDFIKNVKKHSSSSIREDNLQKTEYLARLELKWYKAFDLMEIMIGCCLEIVQEFDDNNISENKDKYILLKRFHARSIRIAKEIIILMRNGYADGALARWRSIFEIIVIAKFIEQNDNELSIMYQEYLNIENYNEMIEFQKRCEYLGVSKLPEKEVENTTNMRKKLEIRYSSKFIKPYGWASKIFIKDDITFNRIMNEVDYSLWKPYYKMACNSVHSGPKSVFFNIGLLNMKDLLLVGPSNIGFTDPAQLTSISLLQITSLLVKLVPSYEKIITLKALENLCFEIPIVFNEIQKQIEIEEKEA